MKVKESLSHHVSTVKTARRSGLIALQKELAH